MRCNDAIERSERLCNENYDRLAGGGGAERDSVTFIDRSSSANKYMTLIDRSLSANKCDSPRCDGMPM